MATRADTSFSVRPDRVTTAQRDLLNPEEGRIIWNLDTKRLEVYDGTAWGSIDQSQGDNFAGGLVDYNDSTTAGTPIVITAGVPTVLTNDGAGAFTNKLFLPEGVTDVWDDVDSFDWSELELGTMVDIRLDISLTTASPNTSVEIDLHLGTGGGAYTIPFVTDADFKTAAVHTVNKYNGIYMGDTNTLDNGGQFKITCDKNSTVIVNGWYIKIIMRGN